MLAASCDGDVADLARLGAVERAGMNQRVDFVDGKFRNRLRRSCGLEQLVRCANRHLVERPNRNHAGDKLFEDGREAFFSELEKRGLGEGLDRLAYAFKRKSQIKCNLVRAEIRPSHRSCPDDADALGDGRVCTIFASNRRADASELPEAGRDEFGEIVVGIAKVEAF